MQGLIDNLKSLGKNKLMMLGGAGIGVVMLMILGIGAVTRPDYAPLYSNLSITSANSIEATLANAGFNAMVSEDGTSISVPRGDAVRARMVLAETGMPIDGDPGWELFDESSGLAMNSFLQKINKMRAMEGNSPAPSRRLTGSRLRGFIWCCPTASLSPAMRLRRVPLSSCAPDPAVR